VKKYEAENCELGIYEARIMQGRGAEVLPDLTRLAESGSTTVVNNRAKALLLKIQN